MLECAVVGIPDDRWGERPKAFVELRAGEAASAEELIAFSREHTCEFLLGNHESMFLDFLGWQGAEYFGGDAFLMNGGDRTLASYDYFAQAGPRQRDFALPSEHAEFFRRLKLYHRDGDYLFVHAGIGRQLLGETDIEWALRRAGAALSARQSRIRLRIALQ